MVAAAGQVEPEKRREALATLCTIYWSPLYHYVRRCGNGPERAQDLTQEFFVRLLEKDVVAAASQARGRFRSFLLASMKNFLLNAHDREVTQKQGGDWIAWSLDWDVAESHLHLEPAHELTPERVYERAWAIALLDRVLERLKTEADAAGKEQAFEVLKEALAGGRDKLPYASLATQLGVSEAAARQAVHRLRKRYREILRDEVSQTVADPAEVEDEIRNLLESLAS
jgi:RNA polymerase sigma-70 factor (ECF subfamily)